MSMRDRLLSSTVFPLIMTLGVGATVVGCAIQADTGTGTGGSYQATTDPCNPCAAKNPISPCNPCNPCAARNPCNPGAAKIPDSPCEPAYEG